MRYSYYFFRLKQVEQTKAKLDAEVKRLKKELENTKSTTSTKITNLTTELTEFKREKEKLTSQLNSEKETKETEIAALKKKITSLEKAGQNTKRMNEMKETYNEKILSTVSKDITTFKILFISEFISQTYRRADVTKFSDLENEIKKHQNEQETLTKNYQELTNSKLQLERENESLNR